MKSGLEGRNNISARTVDARDLEVSMKSGLEGRNNPSSASTASSPANSLNEVRPRRPEQWTDLAITPMGGRQVSMKSGLEGRNNNGYLHIERRWAPVSMKSGLEGRNNVACTRAVVVRNSVSMKSGLEGRNNPPPGRASRLDGGACLNEVRPRRPEQYGLFGFTPKPRNTVSMKSGLEGRNNYAPNGITSVLDLVSMKSGLEGRNNLRRCVTGDVTTSWSQ